VADTKRLDSRGEQRTDEVPEEDVMEEGYMVSEESDTGILRTAPSEQENKINRNVEQGSQTQGRRNRPCGSLYRLICHLGHLYHYRVSFVLDVLHHS
jgi:hypothetical protein